MTKNDFHMSKLEDNIRYYKEVCYSLSNKTKKIIKNYIQLNKKIKEINLLITNISKPQKVIKSSKYQNSFTFPKEKMLTSHIKNIDQNNNILVFQQLIILQVPYY